MNNKLLLSSFKFQAASFYGPDLGINKLFLMQEISYDFNSLLMNICILFSRRFEMCFLRKHSSRESWGGTFQLIKFVIVTNKFGHAYAYIPNAMAIFRLIITALGCFCLFGPLEPTATSIFMIIG